MQRLLVNLSTPWTCIDDKLYIDMGSIHLRVDHLKCTDVTEMITAGETSYLLNRHQTSNENTN